MTIADWVSGLSDIIQGKEINPDAVKAVRMSPLEKNVASVLPGAVGDIASAPTALYGLGSDATNWASKQLGFGDTHWYGDKGAKELTETIRAPFEKVAAQAAGKEEAPNSLTTGTPSELAASWLRLGLQSVPAPAAAYTKLAAGLSKMKSGIDVVDSVGAGLIKAAEVLTPITIAKNPIPAAIGNFGIGGALGVGLETAFPRQQATNDESKGALDVAASGAEEHKDVTTQHPQIVQAGIDPADHPIAVGLLGAAALAYMKRNALYHGLTGIPKEARSTVLDTADALKTNVQDAMTPLTSTYRTAAGVNPGAGEISDQFAGRVAARQGAAINTRVRSIMEQGEIPGSTIKLQAPVDDMYVKFNELDPAKQKQVVDVMNAQRELDMRTRIANQDLSLGLGSTPHIGAQPIGSAGARQQYLAMVGRGLDESKTAYGHFLDDGVTPVAARDLHATITAGAGDPEIKAITDHFQNITDSMGKYMVEQRRISPQEYTSLKRLNPNYYMTELASGQNHLKPLKLEAGGGRDAVGNPMQELPNYIDQVFRKTEFNGVRREYIEAMNRLADSGNQFAKDIMGRKVGESGTHNADEVVSYRDSNAKTQSQVIRDPLVRQALKEGESGGRLHILGGALGKLARVYESAAVGPLATAVGAPFSHTAALYSGIAGAAMRPKGTAAGWIDKGLQAVGVKSGLPGDIIGLAPDMAFRAAQGITAVLAQRVGAALHHSVITDGRIANMMTPGTAEMVAKQLNDHYKRSWLYTLQNEGILGPAGLSMDKSNAIAHTVDSMTKSGQTAQAIKYTSDFVNDILHSISSSPTASIMAMNKDVNKDKLGHVLRDMTGDPGKQGAFKGKGGEALGRATAHTPWGNIFIQANEKLLREMKRNPGKLALGVTAAVGVPQVSASLYNAGLGQEYSDYEFNKRSPDRQAGYIYVGIPGALPDQGLEIPVDPAMRVFKHAFAMLAGAHLGLFDGSLFKPENEDVKDALIEMSKKGAVDTMGSAVKQNFLPPVPPLLGTAFAAGGINLQNYGDARPINDNKSRGFSDTTGKDSNAKFLGFDIPAQAEAVMRSLGANFGGVVYNTAVDGEKRIAAGQGTTDLLDNAWKSVQQRAGDSGKAVSGLFGHFQEISPSQDAAGRLLSDKEKKMTALVGAMNATKNGDMIGGAKRGFSELMGGANSVQTQDPQMLQLAGETAMYYQQFTQAHLGPIKDLYANRLSVQNSTQFSPEKKRAMMNALGEDIIQAQRFALTDIERYENTQSKRYGYDINLDQMSLGKPITQFRQRGLPQ